MYPTVSNLIRHWLRPLRGGAAGVVVVFGCLYAIAIKAGLMGIPLALVLTSWFFKYAYILFDHTTRGFDEPPALDIQMLNPFDEQRPLAQVAILGLIYLAVKLTASHVGAAAAIVLTLICVVSLPASVAILGLESHLLRAANPLEWWRIIHGAGWLYGLVLALIAVNAALLYRLVHVDLWLPLGLGIDLFAVLSIFSFLGGVLYERRFELGLDTHRSPERTAALERSAALKVSEAQVTTAYGLMRAGAHVKCWAMLEEWLAAQGRHPEDYRWLGDHVVRWEDARYITRLTEEHVERLLALKRTGEALDLVAQRLRSDPHFRPKSAAATWSVAQLAARGGGMPRVARALLEDFDTRFPGDPQGPAAAALADHLGGRTA